MKLTIPGEPIAQKRPKFRRTGRHVHTYDPLSGIKLLLRNAILGQLHSMGDLAFSLPLNRVLRVKMTFYMPLPKTLSKRKRTALLDPQSIENYHSKHVDLDNLIKFSADLMNGIVYKDDCQIAEIWAVKLYSDNPRTEIEVTEL